MKELLKNLAFNNHLLEQSPGFLGVLSLNSELITVNKTGLEWIGFDDDESVFGVSYENLNCKAAEDAELFIHQDKLVQKNRNPIYFIGCYCYANENWKIIFGKKYLIKDNLHNPLGIVSQFDDITPYQLIDVSRFIVNATDKYYNKSHQQQFCFLLSDYSIDSKKLSQRELECLFFLIRGKTTKSIAKYLNLSPRTVESYIEQIKFKLGCVKKEELIEMAIYKGYMNILPWSLLRGLNLSSFT